MRIGTHPCMKGLISIDHRHRPIQLLVHDSDTSPDTGRASKSDTEAAPSSASTSAGGDRPAGGQILNNESHGTASSEGRDKVVENPSADKGLSQIASSSLPFDVPTQARRLGLANRVKL